MQTDSTKVVIDRVLVRLCVCIGLSAVVLHTCIRIEIVNARSNGYLPRTDLVNGRLPTWRTAGERTVRKSVERQIAAQRLADAEANRESNVIRENNEIRDASISSEPLAGPPWSQAEQALIEQTLREARQHSELYDWVSGPGLWQYVLIPASLVSAGWLLTTRDRRVRAVACGCAASSVIALVLMFYRGYFTSLGW